MSVLTLAEEVALELGEAVLLQHALQTIVNNVPEVVLAKSYMREAGDYLVNGFVEFRFKQPVIRRGYPIAGYSMPMTGRIISPDSIQVVIDALPQFIDGGGK